MFQPKLKRPSVLKRQASIEGISPVAARKQSLLHMRAVQAAQTSRCVFKPGEFFVDWYVVIVTRYRIAFLSESETTTNATGFGSRSARSSPSMPSRSSP